MGLGGRAKNASTSPQATTEGQGESSTVGAPPARTATGAGWTNILGASELVGRGKGHADQQKEVREKEEDDDKKIRFTIGGVGRRMNKEDFIREIQKLDAGTRREVVKSSTASQEVKTLVQPQQTPAIPTIARRAPSAEEADEGDLDESSSSPERPHVHDDVHPSTEQGETAAERKRRLAVLSAQGDDENETPAERRRREAALGMGDGNDSDQEDRAAAPRIRFAEAERGRR